MMPHTTRCLERIEQLQSKVDERDKTILEQQARIEELISTLKWYIEVYRVAGETLNKKAEIDRLYKQEMGEDINTSALDFALKAERIKALEQLADKVCTFQTRQGKLYITPREIRTMANELKEQS